MTFSLILASEKRKIFFVFHFICKKIPKKEKTKICFHFPFFILCTRFDFWSLIIPLTYG